MKVIQVLPELNSGGVERGTLDVSRHLVAQGHESLVVSAGGKQVARLEAEGGRHRTMPVHRKSLASLGQVAAFRQMLGEEQPDILHVRSRVPAWIAWLAWRKLKASGRPRLVSTVHGFYSVNGYSAVMTRGEAVICVSQSVKAYVLENYPKVPESKLTVIHRGVDPAEFPYGLKAGASTEAARLREEAGQSFVLTLPGRVTDWKGQSEFIDLIGALKAAGQPVIGWVAGGAHVRKQAFYESLKERVGSKGLEAEVRLLGDRDDLKEIMSVSDAVISLSKDPEAFGRVTLEALSLGIPTLGFAHGGVQEQLETLYPGGLIRPHDLSDAARIIRSWIDEGAPPVPPSIEPFTLSGMCGNVVNVYEGLLG